MSEISFFSFLTSDCCLLPVMRGINSVPAASDFAEGVRVSDIAFCIAAYSADVVCHRDIVGQEIGPCGQGDSHAWASLVAGWSLAGIDVLRTASGADTCTQCFLLQSLNRL